MQVVRQSTRACTEHEHVAERLGMRQRFAQQAQRLRVLDRSLRIPTPVAMDLVVVRGDRAFTRNALAIVLGAIERLDADRREQIEQPLPMIVERTANSLETHPCPGMQMLRGELG